MTPIFQIKGLVCEYIKGQPVLEMEELDIPRGKLVFVVGRSGIGKSTFIETLGLMNKTIAENIKTSIGFSGPLDENAIDLKDHWKIPNKELSQFRRKNFSFIFQNTNLMPNFSAGENMMFSMLIQGNTISESKKKVEEVMKMLSLEPEIFEKKITELSGGQRQRLAFVRAVTSKFNVLFGDEPTGNLDEKTSGELMTMLKNVIEKENKTGVIVSHDLDLTLKFADVIIPITCKKGLGDRTIGEVKLNNIIQRVNGQWKDGNERTCIKPREYLNQFLKQTKLS